MINPFLRRQTNVPRHRRSLNFVKKVDISIDIINVVSSLSERAHPPPSLPKSAQHSHQLSAPWEGNRKTLHCSVLDQKFPLRVTHQWWPRFFLVMGDTKPGERFFETSIFCCVGVRGSAVYDVDSIQVNIKECGQTKLAHFDSYKWRGPKSPLPT